MTQYGDEYSLAAIDDLTKPWESGSEAADLCAGAIGDAVANIQYEIDGLDFSSLYELVDLLNQIGMGGYGGGSSSAYEDVTDQGSWQKAKVENGGMETPMMIMSQEIFILLMENNMALMTMGT